MKYSDIGVRAVGRVGPTGDFPVASAEHIFVPVDVLGRPITVDLKTDKNPISWNSGENSGVRLDELLTEFAKEVAAIEKTVPIIKGDIDYVLEPNTQYYLSTKTNVKLVFPAAANIGDSIYVQFISGDTITIQLVDQKNGRNVHINSTNYQANSIIEIHAVYGYIKESTLGWNAIIHTKGVT